MWHSVRQKMTSFTKIYHTLCVLFLLESDIVFPLPHGRGQQYFFAACLSTSEGSAEQFCDLRASCASDNAHTAPAGHIAPAARQTAWASMISPSFVQRSMNEDDNRLTYGSPVHFTTSAIYQKADSEPLLSPSFLQTVRAQIRTNPPHIRYAEHSRGRRRSDALLQPGSSTKSSQVNLQYKLPAFMSLPDTARPDEKSFPDFRTSAQASPERNTSVQNADTHGESKRMTTSFKVGGASFNEKDAAGTSEQRQWYAMRTNFPPRFLRVLAKKIGAGEKQEWYTLLTNFKPQILKLTPE